jgi:hypothetical protein
MTTNIREMIKKARTLYPNSKHNQHSWIRATKYLVESNKHVLYGAQVNWQDR